MTLYTYTVRDRLGKKINGRADAESAELLADDLQTQGLVILSIQGADRAARAEAIRKGEDLGQTRRGLGGFGRKIKLASLVSFTTQLGVMVEAGLPLLRVLEGLAREMENGLRISSEAGGKRSLPQAESAAAAGCEARSAEQSADVKPQPVVEGAKRPRQQAVPKDG